MSLFSSNKELLVGIYSSSREEVLAFWQFNNPSTNVTLSDIRASTEGGNGVLILWGNQFSTFVPSGSAVNYTYTV